MRNRHKNPGGRRPDKPGNIPQRMHQDNEQRNRRSGSGEFAQESSANENQEQVPWQPSRNDHRRSTDPSRQPLPGNPMTEETEMDDALTRSWETED